MLARKIGEKNTHSVSVSTMEGDSICNTYTEVSANPWHAYCEAIGLFLTNSSTFMFKIGLILFKKCERKYAQ